MPINRGNITPPVSFRKIPRLSLIIPVLAHKYTHRSTYHHLLPYAARANRRQLPGDITPPRAITIDTRGIQPIYIYTYTQTQE